MESPPPPEVNTHRRSFAPVLILIGAALMVALALICGLGAVGAIPSLLGLKSPTATAGATPPQATATLTTIATLGGTLGDFVQRYGNSIDDSGLMYAATLAGQRVRISVELDDPRQSRDGQAHVIAIDVQPPSDALGIETWDAATADAIAQMFLPPDAQFQRTVMMYGLTRHIYHSDEMAAAILPGQYTNVPGSLSYYCHPWPPWATAIGYGQCHIAIGAE